MFPLSCSSDFLLPTCGQTHNCIDIMFTHLGTQNHNCSCHVYTPVDLDSQLHRHCVYPADLDSQVHRHHELSGSIKEMLQL